MKTVTQNESKQVLSFENRWDPHVLDDENRKLSDITQNSPHPNKLLMCCWACTMTTGAACRPLQLQEIAILL